jgi:hypothetical protein
MKMARENYGCLPIIANSSCNLRCSTGTRYGAHFAVHAEMLWIGPFILLVGAYLHMVGAYLAQRQGKDSEQFDSRTVEFGCHAMHSDFDSLYHGEARIPYCQVFGSCIASDFCLAGSWGLLSMAGVI